MSVPTNPCDGEPTSGVESGLTPQDVMQLRVMVNDARSSEWAVFGLQNMRAVGNLDMQIKMLDALERVEDLLQDDNRWYHAEDCRDRVDAAMWGADADE